MSHSAPAPSTTPSSGRESWLLIFNCQVLGLSNCLNLLSDEIHVEHYDPKGFRDNAEGIEKRVGSFARVLIAPQIESQLPESITSHPNVWRVPTISFSAYHPDICYLRDQGASLKGPLGDYHSLIAYAAYRKGLSVQNAAKLFRSSIYEQLGYYDRWDQAKNQLLETFAKAEFDLAASFPNWSRNSAFMYSTNHVHVRCLLDVAKAILKRAGKASVYEDTMPHDNLANGPIFPIYPEIGARLGVHGSYLFKLGGQYRFIRLDEFLSRSFELYESAIDPTIIPEHARMLDRALATIEA